MIAIALLAVATLAGVALEIVLPGRAWYHAGWYNVLLAALVVLLAMRGRGAFARAGGGLRRFAVPAIVLGGAVAGVAGIASGLLAPDARTVVGAPGARVRLEDFGGTLVFPAAGVPSAAAPAGRVTLERGGRSLEIGDAPRNAGTLVARALARDIVYVEARDARGGRLTVTQPTGSAFLSPFLLMQQRQTIAGMDLPFDGFSVPAAHRTVKAVLFSPEQAATLRGMSGVEIPAVLFAVDDEEGRPVRNGIALAPEGTTAAVGGLQLHPVVFRYPAVEIVAAPSLAAVSLAALLVAAGIALAAFGAERSKGNVET